MQLSKGGYSKQGAEEKTGPEREEAAGDCRKLNNEDLTIYTVLSPERAPVKGYPAVCNWPSDEAALLRATKKKHPKD
jgi:hypothetical protein